MEPASEVPGIHCEYGVGRQATMESGHDVTEVDAVRGFGRCPAGQGYDRLVQTVSPRPTRM